MSDTKRRQELAQFLRTRRERLAPEAVGLPAGSRRRTPGLRREELAQLAGIGVTWYTRLEQGQDILVSPQVLESLTRVLDLSMDERNHLFVLAREQVPADPYPLTSTISPQLQDILDGISNPAYIINSRWEGVGWNQAMSRLFSGFDINFTRDRNVLRSIFTNPSQRSMLRDWEKEAQVTLAQFRASADRYVREPWFKDLVAELQRDSPEFREWWPRHDIQSTCNGRKEIYNPLVGWMTLQSNTFQVVEAPDLRMTILVGADAAAARKLTQLAEPMEAQLTGKK